MLPRISLGAGDITEIMNCSAQLRKKLRNLPEQGKLELIPIPGSRIHMSTATVARSIRGKHVLILVCTETSNWIRNCQGQGDPFMIAGSRTDAYTGREKVYAESTPTDENSNIEKEARKCKHKLTIYWACPHCGAYQSPDFFLDMKWNEVVNDDGEMEPDYESIYMQCQNPSCEVKEIKEQYKPSMLKEVRFGPISWYEEEMFTKKLSPNSKRKYRRQLYEKNDLMSFEDYKQIKESIWLWHNPLQYPLGLKSWEKIVKNMFFATKNIEEEQPAWNNDLGRAYSGGVAVIKASELMERLENYSRKPLPVGCHFLTAGVDVNGSWISVEVTGWGRDKESWTIDYQEMTCDPSGPAAWKMLDDYLKQTFEHCSGDKLRISAVGIDSGHYTQEVANYVRSVEGSGRNIIAIKGTGRLMAPIINRVPRQYKKEINLTFYQVGTNTAKDVFAKRLEIANAGPGYCHFASFLPASYFEQLAGERPKKDSIHQKGNKWEPIHGKRNEALDCRVYSIAAMEYVTQVKNLNDICAVGERKYFESKRKNRKTTRKS